MSSTEQAVTVGIDVGTSGVRAVALSAQGIAVAFAASPFTPEQTRLPAAWRDGVWKCLRDLATMASLSAVEGVAVDGTSGTVLSVDGSGQATGDVLMYNDRCPDDGIVQRIASVAPLDSPARGANSGLARAIHLSRRAGATHVMHQADWLLLQLGLQQPTSDENNALKSGYDLHGECWPEWLEAAGMERAKLPIVRRAGAKLSKIGSIATNLGLPPSCHFHAGTTDGCASFLATGASRIGEGVTALGSTVVIKLASDRPISAPEFGVYSHRVQGFWLVGGASNSGGSVIRHLIGDDRLDELTRRLKPDQATGLHYYPLLKPGERFPVNDPEYPPQLLPRPDDDAVYFQAILEGITQIEKRGYQRLKEMGAPTLTALRTVGGGARNSCWTRMRETALGVDFLEARSTEAAVGTASLVLAHLDGNP